MRAPTAHLLWPQPSLTTALKTLLINVPVTSKRARTTDERLSAIPAQSESDCAIAGAGAGSQTTAAPMHDHSHASQFCRSTEHADPAPTPSCEQLLQAAEQYMQSADAERQTSHKSNLLDESSAGEFQLALNVVRANSAAASVAQRCYTDALHSVFAFLSLRELPRLLCCRSWRGAVFKEKPRSDLAAWPVFLRSIDRVRQICSSPLNRHVVSVVFDKDTDLSCLQLMRDRLLFVKRMDLIVPNQFQAMSLSPGLVASSHLCFPASLVEIKLSVFQLDCSAVNMFLDAVAKSCSHLQQLSVVGIARQPYENMELSPLARLQKLEILGFYPYNEGTRLQASQLRPLRQLSALSFLNVNDGAWTLDELQELCRPPQALQQLRWINLTETDLMAAMIAQALAYLPLLTSLKAHTVELAVIPLLALFSSLEKLTLSFNHTPVSAVQRAAISAALCGCTKLMM
jgi:hypothetical protein